MATIGIRFYQILFKKVGVRFRGMYYRNIADIIPKWDIADIMSNRDSSTANIPKLSEMAV